MSQMSKFLIFGLISTVLLAVSCNETGRGRVRCKAFKEAILQDPYRLNYLFTMEAIYKGEELRVLINKDQLIRLLNDNDSAKIASMILNDGPLKLSDSTFSKVTVWKPQKNIDDIILNGKEKTLEVFFNTDGWQKKSIEYPMEANLINALTEWCVLVYRDDESGFLRLEERYPSPANYVK